MRNHLEDILTDAREELGRVRGAYAEVKAEHDRYLDPYSGLDIQFREINLNRLAPRLRVVERDAIDVARTVKAIAHDALEDLEEEEDTIETIRLSDQAEQLRRDAEDVRQAASMRNIAATMLGQFA